MADSFVGTWETNWGSFDTGPHDGLTVTVTESFRTDPSGNVLDGMYDAPEVGQRWLQLSPTSQTVPSAWLLDGEGTGESEGASS